jgi:hypothetical protein
MAIPEFFATLEHEFCIRIKTQQKWTPATDS